jgi:DNA repair photolyase
MDFIPAKTIISGYTENSSWFGANYNMNIYKGCSHGCIYCDSRSECYRVDDFDTVRVKENALAVIERDLKSKRKKRRGRHGRHERPV